MKKYAALASITIIMLLQGCRGEEAKSPVIKEPPATPTTRPASGAKVPLKSRKKRVPLKLDIPKEIWCALKSPFDKEPNVEEFSYKSLRESPVFMVPPGTVNLAAGRSLSSNESLPVIGELDMVTDGEKSGEDGNCVNIGCDLKWIQIDLEQSAPIYAIVVWHNWRVGQFYTAYRDVIVQVSSDPEFQRDVKTVFNNDHDNSSGLGRGRDQGYYATRYGKIIYARRVPGRYVRLYSNGNTSNDQNHYVEVAVYGPGQVKASR